MAETIGFVGLGAMGGAMARRLLEAGHPLRVWNRSADKSEPLTRAGAEAAGSPAEAAGRGGIVITMLADDAALEAVTLGETGVLAGLGEGGLHVSMSTVAPASARRLAQVHAERGCAYLAAPVFGRPDVAAAGKLWVLASGAGTARERARPLLEAMGQKVFEFGEDPGAANVVKLAGNFMIVAAVEAMAEAFTFGEKNGIERAALAELFGSTLFACGVYQNYGRMVAAQKPAAGGFRLALALKDVNLALGAAGDSSRADAAREPPARPAAELAGERRRRSRRQPPGTRGLRQRGSEAGRLVDLVDPGAGEAAGRCGLGVAFGIFAGRAFGAGDAGAGADVVDLAEPPVAEPVGDDPDRPAGQFFLAVLIVLGLHLGPLGL